MKWKLLILTTLLSTQLQATELTLTYQLANPISDSPFRFATINLVTDYTKNKRFLNLYGNIGDNSGSLPLTGSCMLTPPTEYFCSIFTVKFNFVVTVNPTASSTENAGVIGVIKEGVIDTNKTSYIVIVP